MIRVAIAIPRTVLPLIAISQWTSKSSFVLWSLWLRYYSDPPANDLNQVSYPYCGRPWCKSWQCTCCITLGRLRHILYDVCKIFRFLLAPSSAFGIHTTTSIEFTQPRSCHLWFEYLLPSVDVKQVRPRWKRAFFSYCVIKPSRNGKRASEKKTEGYSWLRAKPLLTSCKNNLILIANQISKCVTAKK